MQKPQSRFPRVAPSPRYPPGQELSHASAKVSNEKKNLDPLRLPSFSRCFIGRPSGSDRAKTGGFRPTTAGAEPGRYGTAGCAAG